MKTAVYLDYNATTPVDKRVLEAMLPYFTEKFGNASSRTHGFGWIAEDAVTTARKQVADLINCIEQELVFTSGATEAINLAIKGVWENYKIKGNHIITVATEHKAVLDTCQALEKKGAKITYLPVNREGLIDLDDLRKALTPQTILVSVMYANNETGVIQPIQKIAETVHANSSIFMVDATQAVGKININVMDEHIDLMCLSAHKFYGPKGVGALYVRRKNPRVTLFPMIDGGGHERGLRSGTLNVTGIVGLGKACEIAKLEMWDDSARISRLRTKLEQHLCDLEDVYINGSTKNRLFNTTNIAFLKIRSESLIHKIPNIAVSMGSACTSAIAQPSHVLKAMGLSDAESYSSIRFSLGKYTTLEEIDFVIEKVSGAVKQLIF
ncbi:MAG TPA: aminotransferase class V-fold PLP-dependent enzyme [Bacteroidia bacterium]|nr:aminotransferase class V-fold PLP-dependent enzyme [Bacteroidia bacterium]HRG51961.1 aminotransferase class V-fold PLP-dependent enzyme [Bacteroidia bacterium]